MVDDISKEPTLIRKDGFRTVTRLGRYALKQRLGVGGMAEVYLAEQDGPQQFKKTVVVKRILASLAADPQFVQMFVREAQVAARLSHPNVVQIYELGEHNIDGTTEYFIAMEYIDGLTLQRLASASWDQKKAVPVDVVVRTIADAARGLHAAHSLTGNDGEPLKLVHRDISPDNLMVSKDGVTKVLDFGIAKGELGGPKTKTGNVRGKIPYMAPEQVTGQPLDHRSDLWALGVSMYWLLCGERPFDRETDFHTMQAVLTDAPKPPRSLNPKVPEALEKIILRLMAKDKEARGGDALALADELEELASPGTGAGRKPTIAFVKEMSAVKGAVGNPLSEADGARATKPFGVDDKARVDGAPVVDPHSAPPALPSLEIRETVVPRQVTMPNQDNDDVTKNDVAAVNVPTSVIDVQAIESSQPKPRPAETAPPVAPPQIDAPKVDVPPSKPEPRIDAPAGKPEPKSGPKHPVVSMLAPKREGVPASAALFGVLAFMALIVGVIVLVVKNIDTTPGASDAGTTVATVTDAGVAVPAIVDAGVAVPAIVDAGVAVPAIVDAGAPKVADAGAPKIVDAGAPKIVDAGVTAPRSVDAGVVEPPKPVKLVVKATAPARITWELEDGTRVGAGTGALSLPRGTKRIVAVDRVRAQKSALDLAVDASGLKGSVDYTPLLSATLVVNFPAGTDVLLSGSEAVKSGAPIKAIPGEYPVRITTADGKRTIKRVTLKAGETVTIEAGPVGTSPPKPKK